VGAPPAVEVTDVTVAREGRPAVAGVTMRVAPRSVHLLVGPNGAGKSTLLAALLGLVEFRGRIRFHWRGDGRIGYVPQTFAVDPTLPLTVGEFLALTRQRRPVAFGIRAALRAHLDGLLERVGLAGFRMRPLGGLSGGELQKVLVANAIDPAPELLLLDEPSSGLDEIAVRQLEELVLALRRDARTSVLMVSHDPGQVRRIADHVTLLETTVRRTGPPDAVLADGLARALAADSGDGTPGTRTR
jgi:zinc transport system ATP-binding protein